ncbi:MAG: hypothetical protein DWH91_01455 [Planctomycetota bacterium]|nr:MAG: hypothetical protein DWH91_01455 [Planctomycetota bacterium]
MRSWVWTICWGLNLVVSLAGAEPANPLPASPLSPEESQKHFQIDPDCRIELVAAEPDVSAPVSIAFDEKGQLWVVEMHDYPNGPAPGEPGKSRIRVLTDEDGDGKYSNPRVFVDQLLFANGLMHWDGGVLVTTDGKLIYFKDTDGDGKSDLREVWFEGFATENPQLRCNHPTFGPDNWIYVANGLRNGKVRAVRPKWPKPAPEGAKLGEPVDISGRDFRFNPFTGECEAVSGYGQFGLTFDDEGNRYVCSNRNPCMKVIIEERHLKLNPNLAVPRVVEDVSPAGEQSKLYPISRAWTTSNLHAGQFSAACGLIFYRGTALPEKFRNVYCHSFTCDPTGNLVHFNNSEYNRSQREFLASDETWFRPVNTAMGPDGSLYIVDMYRAVIEHPEYMPAELKTRPDLSIGADRGRIWRITSNSSEPGGVSPRTTPLPSDPVDVAKLVTHPNGWHRDIAHRLIVEKGQCEETMAVESTLRSILRREPSDTGSVVALRVLEGMGVLSAEDLVLVVQREALDESVRMESLQQHKKWRKDPSVKQTRPSGLLQEAIVASERHILDDEKYQPREHRLRSILLSLGTGDLQHASRQRLHLALGQLGDAEREPRKELAVESLLDTDFYTETVIGIGLGEAESLPSIAISVLERKPLPHILVEAAVRKATLEEIATIIHHLTRIADVAGVVVAIDTMKSRGILLQSMLDSSKDTQEAWSLFSDSIIAEANRGRLIFPGDELEYSGRERLRLVLRCLSHFELAKAKPAIQRILTLDPATDVLIAAIESCRSYPDPDGMELVLLNFESRTNAVRSAIISALLTSEPRITRLLDLVESSQVSFLEIGQTRLASLQQVKNPEIQARLQKLIAANAPADRSKVLEEYQAALTHEHDPLRGRELFAKNCAQCHKIGDLGVEVAPNISDSRVKTQAQLLTDILDPNRAIDNNYFSYTLVDKAGTVATGIISAETSSSVTLKQPEGKTLTVLRSDIEQLKPNGVSLMPVGFEKQLTVAQMADVISFVKNWRYLDGSVPKEVIK